MNIQFDTQTFGELLHLAKSNNCSIPAVVSILCNKLMLTKNAEIMFDGTIEPFKASMTADEVIKDALER